MNKRGPVVVIDDDMDDQTLIAIAFEQLGYPNELRFFTDGQQALDYLADESSKPFLVLCDLHLPKVTGLEIKQVARSSPALAKCYVPFLFFTTDTGDALVQEAYKLSAQGFFMKATRYEHLLKTIRVIMEYWGECHAPGCAENAAMPAMKVG